MNNGNFLNSLLGMTSANPAVTKSVAAKARTEASDKFQQALEQARPEVAARKPVALRKESVAERAADTARRDSRNEVGKAEVRPKHRTEPSESSKAEPHKSESRETKGVTAESAPAKPEPVGGDKNVYEESQALDAQTDTDTAENQAIDPGVIAAAPAAIPLADLDLALALPIDESAATDAAAESVLLNPALIIPAADTTAEALDAELSPLMAEAQAALTQAGVMQSGKVQLADDQALALQATSGKVLAGVTTEQLLSNDEALAESEAELSTDLEPGDNPDLLFLNSKAALNKTAEASMTAKILDQPAPSADVAKPAALTAAMESLTRLSEAQSPAARAFVVQTGVPVTVGSPQWSQAVGDKVLWLAAQNVSSAEIRLDPPELGALQVKVSVNQDQTSISFSSPHPAVREVLDQQLQRLREMFSDSGLNLVNVDVSDKSFAQQERDQKESSAATANSDQDDEDLVPVGVSQAISMRLVDHYA